MDHGLVQLLAFFIMTGIAHYVGKDAVKRGMSYWPWALFVFFCFIIAFPIYLISRKPLLAASKETNQTTVSSEATKKCPDCAELVKLEASKCRYCGKTFAPPAFVEEALSPSESVMKNSA